MTMCITHVLVLPDFAKQLLLKLIHVLDLPDDAVGASGTRRRLCTSGDRAFSLAPSEPLVPVGQPRLIRRD
jgi:hypothetical protein